MPAPIVDRRDLDILVLASPVELLVFDPHVGKVDLVVEVREVVFAGPFLDLMRIATGPTAAVLAVSIPLVQPFLIVALELVVEGDSVDACFALSEPLRLPQIGVVDLGVVFDLARLCEARVELLAGGLVTVGAV